MKDLDILTHEVYDNHYPNVWIDGEKSKVKYLVSSRDLHRFFKIKKSYRRWIRSLRKMDYVENVDFFKDYTFWTSPWPWKFMDSQLDYQFTLTMVIDVCTMQKSEIGNYMSDFYREFLLRLQQQELELIKKELCRLEKILL